MKGLIIYSSGMEDNEALSTTALLRRSGIEIFSATIEPQRLVKSAFGISLYADLDLKAINLSNFDFLIVPGGAYVAKIIDKDIYIQETIKAFHSKKKLVCAICAAPRFLGRLGLLDGLDFTAYPGSEVDMPKGRYNGDKKVVSLDHIVTARSAGAVFEFAYEIVKKIKGQKEADKLFQSIIY